MIAWGFSIIGLWSCKTKDPELTFGLSNHSETIPKVDMTIVLDGKELITDSISRSPNETVYSFKTQSGKHHLRVNVGSKSLSKAVDFIVSDTDTLVGVFISFIFYQPTKAELDNLQSVYSKILKLDFDTTTVKKEKELAIRIVNNGVVTKDW